ncbi:MAG TPA: hypothetical protein VMR51_02005 [Patescibacteria group bacterium]|nr:hypothetical protein [Patescibacteria group bacterium]
MDPLILAANPGSSSRKYALYTKDKCLVSLNFEHAEDGRIVCTMTTAGKSTVLRSKITQLDDVTEHVVPILDNAGIAKRAHISGIGLRVVAPSRYFLQDHLLDAESVGHLYQLKDKAPLHVSVTLQEVKRLKQHYSDIPIALISDSAFHVTKPDWAWNYAIPLEDADRLEIKRFGYHGISLAAVVKLLTKKHKLPDKLIVCHLGSGSSVSAILNGQSVDTTMGYSPLDGLMMATRSGSIDPAAVLAIKNELKLDDIAMEKYLNKSSGLLGISGSSPDLRDLLEAETTGDYKAGLALRMYVNGAQQAIAKMAASLGGVDGLVFTGTVGDRSFILRQRIIENLSFMGLAVQDSINKRVIEPAKLIRISPRKRLRPVYVITTDEAHEIARRAIICIGL